MAEGFDRYAAQWYGLPTVFNPINLVSHTVTSAGNPIEIDLRNKYTIKGIKKEQEIHSKVKIFVDDDTGVSGGSGNVSSGTGKISMVEDRWNDKLPEGVISQVRQSLSNRQGGGIIRTVGDLVLWPLDLSLWAVDKGVGWTWWGFCRGSWLPMFLVLLLQVIYSLCCPFTDCFHFIDIGFPKAQCCDCPDDGQGAKDTGRG